MGKFAKIILMVFSSLLILIIAAAIIIPLVVDLNDYKPEIEAAVKDKTGRTLLIEGDLNVSVFPWLGISTGKISLSNAPGFAEQYFALIGESDIKVKLMPLLSKKIEVKTVVLKGLELNLAKNEQGFTNWCDLTQPEDPLAEKVDVSTEKADKSSFDISTVVIGGVVLENSQVSWNDLQLGQHIVVKDFNLSSSAITFNEAIALEISFLLTNAEPAITEQLNLSTGLVIDETFQKIQLNQLKLDSVTKGESIPGGLFEAQLLSDIVLDLQQQTLALNKLRLNTNTIDLSGELRATQLNTDVQYSGAIQIATFSPKALLQRLQMDVPETTDKQALQKLGLDFNIQGGADSVAIKNLKLALDDTQIQGNLSVQQFKKPAITFNLAIDDIDIDRYSAPKKEASAQAPVSTPVTTATTIIPVETIRALNVSGDLTIGKLKVAQLKMAGISLNVLAKQGVLKTKHTIKQLYKGQYQGQISINAKNKTPTVSLNEKISNLQIEPLLTDLSPNEPAKMKGTANIAANLNTRGNTIPAFKSSLAGKLNFSLHKGVVTGFNLQKIIDVSKLAFKGKEMKQSYANEQTVFTIIKGSAKIKKGLVNNPDFLAKSSDAEIKGAGTINLVNDALNYKVLATLKKDFNKNKIKLAGRSIEINVAGTINQPSYSTNLMSLMSEKEKKKVDKLVNKGEKEIDKALGKGTGKAVNNLLKSFF